ncbi:ABC transporter permease [Burkholderia cenocepacia]|jgi:lipopolysaccharide transport system permease protein|uniref:Transport permease protein n=1 Tax=Burkholderia cenocepacia (strain ATCC BAA-245 / DSM 16553 / LMG 16656 / NCTC 13227 / J2315 / CF5610) TaxID=216591 RepID=B4ECS2_BURCJ|nr:ABC transporter permease [Burkholderia cenocepacia]KIS48982.1 ABC-2 type transporter family protein [Burkholderia cepacia]AOK33505.1 sugar ABC transporter permease [Burkholderia cenocepacia]EPZ85442.1 ABC transporter, ATP-binding protein [Burkholderia cenocepacia K56-2Valvano]ERI27969.1 ABC transporter, ATP-binding protein [Burkholderia cenocepacia BC7]KKI84271.1 sugar ABC transporter permease [Burkholderia cenocepacia]
MRDNIQSSFPLWRHRRLIYQMTRREVVGRYRGSVLGLLWSFFNPLLLLAVYTFVFSVIFKARWNTGSDSKTEFAVVLFVGMIVFQVFSETINRAPSLIISNANYVKKVVFPLEVLPAVALLVALFHAAISFCVLLLAMVVLGFSVPATVFYFPLVVLPFLLFTLGLSWFLASLGVYIQDIGQSIGLVTTVLMFLTPVFYPVSSLPAHYQHIVSLNPVAFVIEQSRNVVIWGTAPNWLGVLKMLLVSAIVAALGYQWFNRTRKGFADVL